MADARIRTGADKEPDRQSRDTTSRSIADDRKAQDRERFISVMEGALNEALPDLPNIDGFHVCWLSTTNRYDTVQKRARLGYVPVEPKDVPGFEHLTLKSTEHPGMIGWNEMLAYKLPLDKYQAIMAYLHHDKPLDDEEMITQALEGLTDGAGRPLVRDVGDGMQDMGHGKGRPTAPEFSG